MGKRIGCVLLVICLLVGAGGITAFATEADSPFTDVSPSDWFYSAVTFVFEHELMQGIGEATFSPDTMLTRAQVATILYRLAGEPEVEFRAIFSDVPAGEWYSDAIVWANDNNIVQGVGGGLFNPGGYISREAFAAMLYRYASSIGIVTTVPVGFNLNSFHDRNEISAWALDYMMWVNYSQLISGTSSTTLSPQDTASRAQAAVILMRFVTRFG